ncbi:MAG: glycosyltransferase family 4 protein [Cyanobacteria bacterium CRU_2_1]|nr:glycosyltransferase family 4 protein [Cyanobacteria bacterium CRU_2_1]
MKILHLIHHFNRGGIENWLLSMLREIPRNRCEMDICCKGSEIGSLAKVANELGVVVFHCPLGLAHIRFAQSLKQVLIKGHYQILHNHVEAYSGFPVWVAHTLNIPVITSFHNTNFLPQTPLTRLPLLRQLRSLYSGISIRYALYHSELVTGCSQAVLNHLDPCGKSLGDRARVLHYGVNLPTRSAPEMRSSFRDSYGWSADTPLILHVGRLIEQKNHLGLLSIFQHVLEQIPTAKLLIVGDGVLRPAIEHTIAERGLSQAVHLLGLRDDVSFLMNQADVFLFPSLYEGFGLVAIEANAAYLPVVGSQIPGLTEAVQDEKTALLHDVNDIEGMANSVIKLLNNKQYANQMGDAGFRRVKEHYSSKVSAEKLLEIYNEFVPVSNR